jgi:hypothetical protein
MLLSDVVQNPLARAVKKRLFQMDLFLILFLSLMKRTGVLNGSPLSCICVYLSFSDRVCDYAVTGNSE